MDDCSLPEIFTLTLTWSDWEPPSWVLPDALSLHREDPRNSVQVGLGGVKRGQGLGLGLGLWLERVKQG